MELHKIGIVVLLVTVASVCCQEISLQMSTEEPRAIGDDVTFQCEINEFPAGASIVWWKRQGDESVKIGENTELAVEVERYDLETQQANTAILFYLNIRGIKPEDNGDFGCALSTEAENIVYRNLVVSDPVTEVKFLQLAPEEKEFFPGEEFHFHEDKEYLFQCVASGSNPIPDMQMTIGYGDSVTSLNDNFNRTNDLISDPSSGTAAFRKTNYRGTLTAFRPIDITWKANSQELGCSARVANMDEPMSVMIKPILKISPILECPESVVMPIWKADVSFECNVYADPELQDIRWYWGDEFRASSLTPGEVLGAFKFDLLPGTKPDMKIARISIRRVFIQMYRDYHIAAKNVKGLTISTVKMVKEPDSGKMTSGSQATISSIILFTMVAILRNILY